MLETAPILADILALINDVLQAIIVIFGTAVFLYNLRLSRRDRVTRAFNALLFFVIIVFLTELMAIRTTLTGSAEVWLRLQWVGIAMAPAAQFHLADALLAITGNISRRRRLLVRSSYLTGVAFLLLVAFSAYIVGELVSVPRAPHLRAGPLFAVFAVYFWAITFASIYYVWRARLRSITSTTRKRMNMILVAFLAAPLGVFPYMLLSNNPALGDSLLFWLILIIGNVVISVMFALLTYYIAYFGAFSPDRVVRVRLFKFMARVPLAAAILLIVYILVNRTSTLLGLPVETALAFAMVATVMLVQWAIYITKQPLERLLQLNDEPEVRRIQELSERLLTTRDLHQFLESVLVAICDALRSPSAFVAAFTPDGPQVEVMVGISPEDELSWDEESWRELAQPLAAQIEQSGAEGHADDEDHASNGVSVKAKPASGEAFILWQQYWIQPLYSRRGDNLLGILGIQARAGKPDLSPAEHSVFNQLVVQAAQALEDRLLQQGVFAAVEGLLPQMRAWQRRRSVAAYATATLTDPSEEEEPLVNDPDFYNMVWDAMSHYWGGPKLTESPLLRLEVVRRTMDEHDGSPTRALRDILAKAIEQQKPDGERSMTTAEWILYNILELKFVQGRKVRDVARRLAMSESDLYRKQRVAIENVARAISNMERAARTGEETQDDSIVTA